VHHEISLVCRLTDSSPVQSGSKIIPLVDEELGHRKARVVPIQGTDGGAPAQEFPGPEAATDDSMGTGRRYSGRMDATQERARDRKWRKVRFF